MSAPSILFMHPIAQTGFPKFSLKIPKNFILDLGHPTVTEEPLSHVKSRLAKHTCRSAFLADMIL